MARRSIWARTYRCARERRGGPSSSPTWWPTRRPSGNGSRYRSTPEHRSALSLGHTGCHLAALALNRALAGRWSKELPLDGLGAPNFDAAANSSSRILPRGSVDTYRLNKSLRRKGFLVEDLAEALPSLQEALNASLAAWIEADAPVRVDRDGDRLTDRRLWVCTLPQGEVSIPCGGTHASALGELGALRAGLTLTDEGGTAVLTMTTGVVG